MNNDSSDEILTLQCYKQKCLQKKNNKSNLNPSKIDNDKVVDSNKKRHLSNEKPPILQLIGGMGISNQKNNLISRNFSEWMNLEPP